MSDANHPTRTQGALFVAALAVATWAVGWLLSTVPLVYILEMVATLVLIFPVSLTVAGALSAGNRMEEAWWNIGIMAAAFVAIACDMAAR